MKKVKILEIKLNGEDFTWKFDDLNNKEIAKRGLTFCLSDLLKNLEKDWDKQDFKDLIKRLDDVLSMFKGVL